MASNALVTGGGSGIGAAFAMALGVEAHRVVVADIDETAAARTAAAIRSAGGTATEVACDVRSDDDVQRLAEIAGDVEVLVHCPGVAVVGPPTAIPIHLWTNVFEVNFFGTVRVVNAVVPGMLERHRGRVVLVSSIAGLMPVGARNAAYASSKAALNSFAESVRESALRNGVSVTLLCPGPVRTNIGARITVVGPPDDTPINPHATMPHLDPGAVAIQALRASRRGEFLVLTHAGFRDELVQRAHQLEAMANELVSGTSVRR